METIDSLIESYLYFLSLATGYRVLRTLLVTAHVTGPTASGVRAPDHDSCHILRIRIHGSPCYKYVIDLFY
jgi:hypothetical protein